MVTPSLGEFNFSFSVSLPLVSAPIGGSGPNSVHLTHEKRVFNVSSSLAPSKHAAYVLNIGVVQQVGLKRREGDMKRKIIRNFVTI